MLESLLKKVAGLKAIRGLQARIKFAKKKAVRGKTLIFVVSPFCAPSFIFLTLAFERVALYGNVAFSVVVISI